MSLHFIIFIKLSLNKIYFCGTPSRIIVEKKYTKEKEDLVILPYTCTCYERKELYRLELCQKQNLLKTEIEHNTIPLTS